MTLDEVNNIEHLKFHDQKCSLAFLCHIFVCFKIQYLSMYMYVCVEIHVHVHVHGQVLYFNILYFMHARYMYNVCVRFSMYTVRV